MVPFHYRKVVSSNEGEGQSRICIKETRIALTPIKFSNLFESLKSKVGSPMLGNH